MIPVTAFAGKKVAVFGLGGSGLASAQALKAGGADVIGLTTTPRVSRRRKAAGIADRRPAQDRLVQHRGAGAGAGRAAHASVAALVGATRGAAGAEIIGDVELFCRERRKVRAEFAVRRDHRYQRQVDHHRAGRIISWMRRAARPQLGGNIGTAVLTLEPPRRRSRPCDRVLVLPDRSCAHDRSARRHMHQCQRRSSRSPRHDRALRRGEGAAGRGRAE